MKAPFTLSSAIEKAILVVAFLPLVTVVYPETVAVAHAAQNPEQIALVFEVNSKAKTEITENQNQLTYDQLIQNELTKNDLLVAKVRAYLEAKGSPLAVYADEIVQQPQWQRALAISYVESNFGKRCANNNCSGIGVKPGHKSWRKYPTKLDWFKDMSRLLEKPIYKDKYTNCNTMKGVYVVPGSPRWVNGCNKVSNELLAITAQAEQEQLALANPTLTAAAQEVAIIK
jgi:hypothetical protein